MKFLKTVVLATALFATAHTHAEVRLLVDDNIKVTAINGQEIFHSALQPLKREFTLQSGNHVITARYDRLFDLTRGNHDYLKSGNITVTAHLKNNQTYQLTMPNQPNTYNAAKEYAKAPTLAVSHNGQIIAQESIVEDRSGALTGIAQGIGGMFGRGNAVTANQKAIAALNQNTTPVAKDNLDGFMQLWLNSSEEEREKIRQWVQQ